MIKYFLFLICVAVWFMSCSSESPAINIAFNKMLDDYYEDGLKLNPLQSTFDGDNRYNNQFPNTLSDDYRSKLAAYYKNYSGKLSQYIDSDLNDNEKMSKAVLKWECDINLERLFFREDLLPINQMWSVNLLIGQLATGTSAQPFNTVEDYYNWLQRLEGYLEWLASAEERMKEGMQSGYVLPKSLIVKVLPQLKALTVEDPDTNLFYSPVKNFPSTFSENEKNAMTESYRKLIGERVVPAYKELYHFMSEDYLAAGRESSGIDGIPDGKAYYQHQIKTYTTTTMTADDIHQLGLAEVSRILSEMEKVKTEVGFKGDLKSFFNFVRNKKELMPFTKPQQVIEHFNAIHEQIKPHINLLFDLKPETGFIIKRTEAFREKSASAQYNPGSLDGQRPGVFYVPIPDATKYNTYRDQSLFLHETIPGHHFQMSLAQENDDLPRFRKTLWYSSYGEGWALYAESLGKELGLYTDPYQYFGMLGAEMHRAIRLVVDTGIHSKGWTCEQAIEYSLQNEALSEASIISEIERYMANPGQALSYKIGQLKILELRHKAEKELGKKFDIRRFHHQILQTGCIPIALLEEKINTWIGNSK